MRFRATKNHQQRQDEEAARLVRPNPKVKPPRRDLRRERVQEPDPDAKKPDKDISKNFKDIGGSLIQRVVQGAKDRIPAKSRETGEIVNISPETLKEKPNLYEAVDPAEAESKSPDKPVEEKGESGEVEKPKTDAPDKEEFYSKAGDAFREMAKDNPGLKQKLRQFTTPGAFFHGMVKENPEFPADKFFPNMKLPEGVQTIADVQKAMEAKPKPPGKKPPKGEVAPKDEPKSETKPNEEAPPKAEEGNQDANEPAEEGSDKKAPAAPSEPEDAPEDDEGSEDFDESEDDEDESEDAESEDDEEEPEVKQEVSEAQKAGISEPQRPEPSELDQQEALSLLLHAFPAETAAQYSSMHPQDVKTLVRDYNAAKMGVKVKDAGEFASKVSGFYETDPNKIKPPTEWRTKDGGKVAFDSLPPDEKSVAMRQHQMRILALSLAAKDALTKKFSQISPLTDKPRIPEKLASILATSMLKKTSPERADKFAHAIYRSTLKISAQEGPQPIKDAAIKNTLAQIKGNPVALKAAKAYFQANDYETVKNKYLNTQSPDQISERDSPKGIAQGLVKASDFFKKRNALYGDDHEIHPSQRLFRTRVMDKLRALDPQKAEKVQGLLGKVDANEYKDLHSKWESKHKKWEAQKQSHEKAAEAYLANPKGKKPPGAFAEEEPHEPEEPVLPEGSEVDPKKASEMWDDAFEAMPKTASVFTYSRGSVMGSVSKLSVYHGVDPYAYGPPDYPGWMQAHQRDIGESDYKTIVAEAKTWLTSPLLSVVDEGMLPDTKFRAALDLAIYTSRYNGAINANDYSMMLARLAGVEEPGLNKTLLTIRTKTAGYGYGIDTFYLLIYGNSSPINRDLIDDLQHSYFDFKDEDGETHDDGHVDIRDLKLGPSLTHSQEKQGQIREAVVRVDYPKGSEAAAMAAITKTLKAYKLKGEKVRAGTKPGVRNASTNSTSSFTPTTDIGGIDPMKASQEIRKYAAQAAKTDSKLGFELLAFADRLAEEEKKGLPPWLKDKVEDKGEEKKEEKKEASDKYASLRSTVIKVAAASPEARQTFLPLLQAIKTLG